MPMFSLVREAQKVIWNYSRPLVTHCHMAQRDEAPPVLETSQVRSPRLSGVCHTYPGPCSNKIILFQMCMERANPVMDIDNFLRNTTEIDNKIKDLNRKVDKLVRFCNQTEQALTHLEALSTVAKSEEEVNVIRQQSRSAMTIINMDSGPSSLSGRGGRE